MQYNHQYFMQQALQQAQYAFDEDEVPVGAIVVINNKIISRAYNQVEKLQDPTAHAEILAMTSAFSYLGAKYLPDAVLYVTVEPCLMCAGASYWSKLSHIVFGAADDKNGYRKNMAAGTHPFHPKTIVTGGILQDECSFLMTNFFRQKRF